MKLREFIINDIKPVGSNSQVSDLQLLFNQLTYSHIPIKDANGVFIGVLYEADVHCFDSAKSVSEYLYAIEDFYVRNSTLWLDVLEAFATNSANVMPVLDDKNNYLGYYELKDIISLFNESAFFNSPGVVLVVEKGINDYSFSEISQIVESNNGKLLGAFVSRTTNDMVQVTLKIGNININEIIQTFRRYSYKIASEHQDDSYIENLKERSDYLNKYLNM
ncbi:CBS domain-containing protein [Seonamhaeicola sp. MEBiC1930]|uniref:CBS domain-containing protein n=1 Tax=Seonamhaeicola sp. MEBiC01930 TaxID=2976768 RepID=UPI003249FEC6